MGASVVSLEPQPWLFRALRLLYSRNPNVNLIRAAAGAVSGTLDFYVNSANPTVSSASTEFIAASRDAPTWSGQVWDHRIEVPVTTLDRLIERFGTPDFIKIDVEGLELSVLMGLTQAVRALSFEFTTIQIEVARRCLKRLDELADYEFNFSLGEDHKLREPVWQDRTGLCDCLSQLPLRANSGDIFARLRAR